MCIDLGPQVIKGCHGWSPQEILTLWLQVLKSILSHKFCQIKNSVWSARAIGDWECVTLDVTEHRHKFALVGRTFIIPRRLGWHWACTHLRQDTLLLFCFHVKALNNSFCFTEFKTKSCNSGWTVIKLPMRST